MTAVSPASFPTGRILANWGRQLAACFPHVSKAAAHRSPEPERPAFWIIHLDLHRIEALVQVTRGAQLERVAQLALIPLAFHADASLEQLSAVFPLGLPALRHTLQTLSAGGLVHVDADGRWSLTEHGQQAHRDGSYRLVTTERRVFYFDEGSRAKTPLVFLPLRTQGVASRPAQDWAFDLGTLRQCVAQSPEWKQHHQFPLDVDGVLSLPANGPAAVSWQHVAVDQAEKLTLVVGIHAEPRDGEHVRGYAVQPKGWTIQTQTPALEMGCPIREVFPDLANDPPAEQWRRAWCEWAITHGVSAADAEACKVQRRDQRLRVLANRAILERLRGARGEPLRNEAWALVGEGRWRAAAPLEIAGN